MSTTKVWINSNRIDDEDNDSDNVVVEGMLSNETKRYIMNNPTRIDNEIESSDNDNEDEEKDIILYATETPKEIQTKDKSKQEGMSMKIGIYISDNKMRLFRDILIICCAFIFVYSIKSFMTIFYYT